MLKDNKSLNKYYGFIKPKFEGKAYIIENCKEKQELKSNHIYRKKGKHITASTVILPDRLHEVDTDTFPALQEGTLLSREKSNSSSSLVK